MQEKINAWLSFLLLLGIFLSVVLVIAGAVLYLLQQGQNPISYQHFSESSNTYTSFSQVIDGLLALKPFALILFGFFLLVFTQILRVLVIGFYFLRSSEYILAFFSLFIFVLLVYSVLWQE